MKLQVPLNRREQVDKMLEEESSPMPRLDERIIQGTVELGPVNTPLPKTIEPTCRVFSGTKRTPYFADSHMVTPKRTPRVTESTQQRYQVEAEGVTGDEHFEGSDNEYDNVRELDEGSSVELWRCAKQVK